MKGVMRILTLLLSVSEGIGWSLFTSWVWKFGNSFRGMGDGAGTDSGGSQMLSVLLIVVIWLIPVSPYALLVSGSFGLISGNKPLRTAHIYSYFVLVVVSLFELMTFRGILALMALGNVALVALWIWFTRKSSERTEGSAV